MYEKEDVNDDDDDDEEEDAKEEEEEEYLLCSVAEVDGTVLQGHRSWNLECCCSVTELLPCDGYFGASHCRAGYRRELEK